MAGRFGWSGRIGRIGRPGPAGAERPTVARLRRLRWRLTALFTCTTAFCLAVLSFVAVGIDARSRGNTFDSELDRRATGLSRAVWYDEEGTLHLDPLAEDELALAPPAVAVLEHDGTGLDTVWAHPSTAAFSAPRDLDRLWAGAVKRQSTVLGTSRDAYGRTLRLAASPVWDGDRIHAVVVVAGDTGPGDRDHRRLVLSLTVGSLALLMGSAVIGHLLSGRSMRPALQALDQREQFLAEAAHELRTPLATLRLAVEEGSDAARLVDRMGRLVAGLLARARVQLGTQQVEQTPLRLDQVVEQVVEEMPPLGAELTLDTEPVVVSGDPELLAQAVRNMLENAARHGAAPGERPRVEVTVAGGRVSVRDHGPGVPAAERERALGPGAPTAGSTAGRRGAAGTAAPAVGGGTGIGLPILRWVADLHGGTVRIGTAPGGGALVELCLPAARTHHPPPQA